LTSTPTDPASNPVGISFLQAQAGYHSNAEARRAARVELTKALKRKAQGEHDYRKELAKAFAVERANGQTVVGAEINAKAAAAGKALERDMADVDAKSAQARLAELEGERASLRQLIDWSREEAAA